MPTYFPQINSTSWITTQLPYKSGLAYETVVQAIEAAGMRYTFSRRSNTNLPDDYSPNPLGKFMVTFPMITDAEVATLKTFFESMFGRYGTFRLLDPGGNLIQYSEDFTSPTWDLTNGPIGIPGRATDPFGGNLATQLSAAAANSFAMSVVGPADGGINGFRVTVSAYVYAQSANQQLFIGFVDSGFATLDGTTWKLPHNQWVRISHSSTLWNNNYFRAIIGGFTTWDGTIINVYGVQVSAMKGEGVYVRSPDNYGYHPNCRFDIDSFQRQSSGPNQNSVQLPIVEFNVPS